MLHPTELRLTQMSYPKNIMSPVYRSFADPTKLMIYRETLQNIPLWQKNPPKYTTLWRAAL
jgi:hypothetical protein